MKNMKASLLGSIVSLALALAAYAQSPTVAPELPAASPSATMAATPVSPATSPALVPTPSARNEFADKIKQKTDRKFKHKGFDITIDGNDADEHGTVHGSGDIPEGVFPVVAITMLAIFGFPVAIVAVIMFSSWAKARSLHRTVRMMVEKGQPVPPELFALPAGAPIRPWYDLRRGIVLLGTGAK